MINLQQIEKQELAPDGSVQVVNVWKTIQGEGPLVGCPAIFIRLAGCNLQCPLCDTDYTTTRQFLMPMDVLRMVRGVTGLAYKPLVVLTGGEPLRQNLSLLTEMLLAEGHKIQIETNGTLYQPYLPYNRMTIVCSPKAPTLHPRLKEHIRAFKYVVQHGMTDPMDGLPTSTLGNSCGVYKPWKSFKRSDIYVQPADEGDEIKNRYNTQQAIDSCLTHGYRLCLQTHKILGME